MLRIDFGELLLYMSREGFAKTFSLRARTTRFRFVFFISAIVNDYITSDFQDYYLSEHVTLILAMGVASF